MMMIMMMTMNIIIMIIDDATTTTTNNYIIIIVTMTQAPGRTLPRPTGRGTGRRRPDRRDGSGAVHPFAYLLLAFWGLGALGASGL